MINRGLFTSISGYWKTPEDFYRILDAEFEFTFDPCPVNPTFDGLLVQWTGNVFVNPPYGREIGKWTRKGADEWDNWTIRRNPKSPKLIVWLVPARTDTAWFQDDLLPRASQIRFIRGRLHFSGSKNSAPFPSMVVVFQ